MTVEPWIKTACRKLGDLPSRYVTFDVETTGVHPSDLLAQVAFLFFEDDRLVREETLWVDHVSALLPTSLADLETKLAHTRQKIEAKQQKYNIKYAVSVERMRAGVPVDHARDKIRGWLDFGRKEGVPFVGHNPKFDARYITPFVGQPGLDGVPVIDTDVIERSVQARPLVQHRSWSEYTKNCSGLGGNKYRSNLSDWCATKYGWHDRGLVDMNMAHDARCDAYLTHLLIQEYKTAARNFPVS